MKKTERYLFIVALIAIPIIIYAYFLKWRTGTIYGDDLQMFSEHSRLTSLYDKIHLLVPLKKYRPVQGVFMHIVMECFQKNVHAYYLFNVAVQTANTFIFAALLNFFLRSPLLSLLFSLTLGISRFAFFNMTQLLNGGPLEALAMTFFLLSLFYMIRAMVKTELTSSQKQKEILLSILFANLSMYTHERYIVIFPFIIVVVLLFPGLKALSKKQKITLSLISAASILLNFGIKKYVYSLPFFVGTAGTEMSPSVTIIADFFRRAVLSIFQINSGDGYLVGITFTNLPRIDKIFVVFVLVVTLSIFLLFLLQVWKSYRSKRETDYSRFVLFVFLWMLFGIMLVPAVATIRLEQRWLQASSAVFILLIVIALCELPFKSDRIKNIVFCIFAFLFLAADIDYLHKGGDYLYMVYAEKDAAAFRDAISTNIIRPETEDLYLFEIKKDIGAENTYRWFLLDGHIFEFYQGKLKKLIFVDSTDQKENSFPLAAIAKFKGGKAQVIEYNRHGGREVADITADYLKGILNSLPDSVSAVRGMPYYPSHFLVTVDDLDNFTAKGFYADENGFRWTDGDASLGFKSDYLLKDSIILELNTFMPPVCKDIVPKIILKGGNAELQPVASKREGDRFIYTFYFSRPVNIQQIDIRADTLHNLPDKRKMSFPFLSLELKR